MQGTVGSPVPASALMGGPALAPPSPQALSGMNPSQMILSQPALQMSSQPDVQSALATPDAGNGVRKPQVHEHLPKVLKSRSVQVLKVKHLPVVSSGFKGAAISLAVGCGKRPCCPRCRKESKRSCVSCFS